MKKHNDPSVPLTKRRWLPLAPLLVVVLGALASAATPRSSDNEYAVLATIPGQPADGIWDYATFDGTAQRLYLAQNGVTVLDARTGLVSSMLSQEPTPGSIVPIHAVVPLGTSDVAAFSDSSKNAVVFFHATTGKTIAMALTTSDRRPGGWHDPDALVYDPATGYLIAVNGDSGTLSLIDVARYGIAGEISVGGKLESAAADGQGLLYVNEEDKGRIAVVDIAHRKLVREFTLKNCSEPTGIAYDEPDRLIISVCSNGLAKFVSTRDGSEVSSVKVGTGADCIVYDGKRHVVFSPSGEEGSLSIISVEVPSRIKLKQTIKTRIGSRLGALDP
jgi:DNA-binding beta-propeller fold protein YncE